MHWIDPDHLPEITGTVDQFLVNKHGEADGFLLTDGEEVHVPPHCRRRCCATFVQAARSRCGVFGRAASG